MPTKEMGTAASDIDADVDADVDVDVDDDCCTNGWSSRDSIGTNVLGVDVDVVGIDSVVAVLSRSCRLCLALSKDIEEAATDTDTDTDGARIVIDTNNGNERTKFMMDGWMDGLIPKDPKETGCCAML
mmetsp:Transcript_19699/g.41481  ORF Transcript_19699/g.41481 Transcript_19699/m.41481 type:complete len:128 (-) Transcript_19699:129-512(-)